jgi:endoplasmic reticulum junction formation protein lunapark
MNIHNQPISPGLQHQLACTFPRSRSWSHLFYIYTESFFTETPQQPLPLPCKLWYDKLADALLGDDESSVNPVASRYALICQKCFAHNGLMKEEMWEDTRTHDLLLLAYRVGIKAYHFCWIEYVCPKCRYFNPSARSQHEGLQLQPQTPTTQTLQRPELRDASPQGAP